MEPDELDEMDKLFTEIITDLHKMLLYDHKNRSVNKTIINGAKIDTCLVTDSLLPYETAICHKCYNDGNWIIVEVYDTKEKAKCGHDKWVKLFEDKLPTYLVNVDNTKMGKFIGKIINQTFDSIYKRKDDKT